MKGLLLDHSEEHLLNKQNLSAQGETLSYKENIDIIIQRKA